MTAIPARCLVVEDDPSWQQILAEILGDLGLRVDQADSLQAGEALLRQRAYRLAVVDLSLAGRDHHNQDGLEVLQAIRRLAPGCAAVLLTGYASVELAVSALQDYGAYTCLRKENFRRSEFRQVIHQALALPPALGRAMDAEPGMGAPGVLAGDRQAAEASSGGAAALVVEDDAGWRELLAELLAEAGLQPQTCASYGEALGLLKRRRYALAVADLSLASSLRPDDNLDGYRLLSGTQRAGIPTIVVSGYAGPELVEEAYDRYGAFACMEKQAFERAAFLETVHRARQAAPLDPLLESLTGRERETLRLLRQGKTNKEIAKELYITTNTVKRHLKSIYDKLGVNTRAAASARASEMGL